MSEADEYVSAKNVVMRLIDAHGLEGLSWILMSALHQKARQPGFVRAAACERLVEAIGRIRDQEAAMDSMATKTLKDGIGR